MEGKYLAFVISMFMFSSVILSFLPVANKYVDNISKCNVEYNHVVK